jgi:hypothetical protein
LLEDGGKKYVVPMNKYNETLTKRMSKAFSSNTTQ